MSPVPKLDRMPCRIAVSRKRAVRQSSFHIQPVRVFCASHIHCRNSPFPILNFPLLNGIFEPFFCLSQIEHQHFGNALLLHGHAVQDIGGLHGAAAVGDDDELGLIAHPAQILCKAADIGIIQSGFDLVQDAERCRVDGQDRKIDADGHQRLLAAGKGFQILDDFARRCHLNANAAGKHIAFILQHKAGFAAAKQLGKDAAEIFVDGPEAVGEDLLHLAGQAGDHPRQLVPAALHIGHLSAQGIVPLPDLLIFLNGADVHIAQRPDLIAQIGHLRPQGGQAVELHAEFLGLAHRQLVFIPELGGGGIVFALSGCFPLGQTTPFIKDDVSSHKNSAALAISSGFPK